jgi:hypothetical protein
MVYQNIRCTYIYVCTTCKSKMHWHFLVFDIGLQIPLDFMCVSRNRTNSQVSIYCGTEGVLSIFKCTIYTLMQHNCLAKYFQHHFHNSTLLPVCHKLGTQSPTTKCHTSTKLFFSSSTNLSHICLPLHLLGPGEVGRFNRCASRITQINYSMILFC